MGERPACGAERRAAEKAQAPLSDRQESTALAVGWMVLWVLMKVLGWMVLHAIAVSPAHVWSWFGPCRRAHYENEKATPRDRDNAAAGNTQDPNMRQTTCNRRAPAAGVSPSHWFSLSMSISPSSSNPTLVTV